jgi:hypothetical protein
MDGEVVTERALDIFVAMFKEETSRDAVRALPLFDEANLDRTPA